MSLLDMQGMALRDGDSTRGVARSTAGGTPSTASVRNCNNQSTFSALAACNGIGNL